MANQVLRSDAVATRVREAARNNLLLVPYCKDCSEAHWYPRAICPFCFSADIGVREASGSGQVYSFSSMRGASGPHTIAYVTRSNGPTMMSNIETDRPQDLRIGQEVKVRFRLLEEGRKLPVFAPAAEVVEGER